MANLSLYVATLGTEKTAWTREGASPYLDVQDQPTNYVYSSVKKAQIGDFTFDSTAASGTINSVTLYVYGQTSNGTDITDFFIHDGASWSGSYPLTFDASYSWKNVAITATLDSWTKINAALMYIAHENAANLCDIDAAYIYVDYTPSTLDSEDVKSASTRIALVSEDTVSASTRIKLVSEDIKSASTRIAYTGEDTKSASTNIKIQTQDVKEASTRILVISDAEDVKSASTRVAYTTQDTKSGSTRVVSYEIAGVTKDKDGNTLASCHCFLFKDNQDDTLTFSGYDLSDGSGNYNIRTADNDAQYLVYSFKDDTPHVFDVTDHVLQPSVV